jgi:hypothetical protein
VAVSALRYSFSRHMSDPIVALEVLSGAVGAAGVVGGYVRHRMRRAPDPFLEGPKTAIAAANDGPVKIAGALKVLDESLVAPFSGRPCAYWDVTITADVANSEGGVTSRPIFFKRMARDFLVEDDTGTALVRCPGWLLDFVIERGYGQAFPGQEHQIQRFLSDFGYVPGHGDAGPRTYFERALVPGERVAVYGVGHRETDPDAAAAGGSYRERPTRLVVEPIDGRLRVSNARDVVGRP